MHNLQVPVFNYHKTNVINHPQDNDPLNFGWLNYTEAKILTFVTSAKYCRPTRVTSAIEENIQKTTYFTILLREDGGEWLTDKIVMRERRRERRNSDTVEIGHDQLVL